MNFELRKAAKDVRSILDICLWNKQRRNQASSKGLSLRIKAPLKRGPLQRKVAVCVALDRTVNIIGLGYGSHLGA